jgi:hypothetical protein
MASLFGRAPFLPATLRYAKDEREGGCVYCGLLKTTLYPTPAVHLSQSVEKAREMRWNAQGKSLPELLRSHSAHGGSDARARLFDL